MISKELLEILACPSCKGDLSYDAEKALLICHGKHCPNCGMPLDTAGDCTQEGCGAAKPQAVGLEYRIEEDIPIMLIDEARKFPLQ